MDELRLEIQHQEPNTPILSERDLEKKYNASRMTIRKAINGLVEEGVLYRVPQIGTFVADQKLVKKSTAMLVSNSF
ncbi:MAG: GntR family transcriptional regulator, partial [Erysipelothrix sp.]|nr:GntR family transcriptional regulator [Erysipelothrix sp.]